MDWVRDHCDSWYVAHEEDANRPHYQAYVRFKPKYENINSLRNQLKKVLSGSGNAVYSLRGLKKPREHLVCYLLKENKPVSKSIEIEILRQAEALQAEIQSRTKDKHRPIMECLMDLFPPRGRAYSQDEMVDRIVRWFNTEGRLQPDMYMLAKYIRTLCASMDIDRYVQVAQAEFSTKFSQVQILSPPEFFSQDEVSQ